jgi:hypothetical protein
MQQYRRMSKQAGDETGSTGAQVAGNNRTVMMMVRVIYVRALALQMCYKGGSISNW